MSKELDKHFPEYESLYSRQAYDFYRQNRKAPAEGINEYNYYKKAVSGLFNVVANMIVESEGGVYIEGIGYFCNIAYPTEEKAAGIQPKSLFQRLKKYQYYFPYFFPDIELEGWTMSDSFVDNIERKLNLQEIKYKLHFDLVDTMRIANDSAKKYKDHRKIRGDFAYRGGRLHKKLNK